VGADGRAVEHDLGEVGMAGVAQMLEDALPDTELRPPDVQVRHTRPRPEGLGDGAPARAVAQPPDDALDGASHIGNGSSAAGSGVVDGVSERAPLLVGQLGHGWFGERAPKLHRFT
jgi:hypothetical protein